MRKILIYLLAIILSLSLGWWAHSLYKSSSEIIEPVTRIKPRPLDKYTIENLSKITPTKGVIKIGEILEEKDAYFSYILSFEFDPTLSKGDLKRTTGQINIPKGEAKFPLIIMLRGYVDQERYKTGTGTESAADYFAQNGFITLAPDFLGYADSSDQAENVMEARFQTYTTILSLLETIEDLRYWDGKNIFFWGHSNGGQIAITVLEITKKFIPTTLWAPVSKPFPYSVLYYTDEAEDRGKYLRREIAKFEETYNPDLYSIDLNFQRIKSPLQIHQGTADDAVPKDWSDELFEKLDELEIEVDYFVYPGADHNLKPSWDTVVARDLAFFDKYLK